MYNEAQKRKFLQSIPQSYQIRVVFLFGIAEEYEVTHDLDIACMTTEQLDEAIRSKTDSSTTTMDLYARIIKRYKSWCQSEGFPTNHPHDTLTATTSSLKASRYIFSPAQLHFILDQALLPVDYKSPDNFARAACWLAFSGVSVELCGHVTPSTLDFHNMVLTLGGQQFPLYQESLPSFQSLCYDDSFISYRSDGEKRVGRRALPADNDPIFIGTRSSQTSFASRTNNWRRQLKQQTANTEYADMLIFENLRISGICYAIHQHCILYPSDIRQAEENNVVETIINRDQQLTAALSPSSVTDTNQKRASAAYRRRTKYKNEYKVWQQAFAEWLALDSISDQ